MERSEWCEKHGLGYRGTCPECATGVEPITSRRNINQKPGFAREEYSELVMSLLDAASFPGKEAGNVVELKRITELLADGDPWT